MHDLVYQWDRLRDYGECVLMVIQQMLLGAGSDLADAIIAQALVDLNSDGISGTGASIAWANAGLGGSGYDLDTPTGTTSNLTQGAVNGQTVIDSAGSAGLEPSSGQLITDSFTLIVVAKFDSADPTNERLISSKSSSTNRLDLFSRNDSSDKFAVFAGASAVVLSEAYDTNPHVWILQYSKDVNTKLTVDGVGTVTGDAGSNSFDYITLFNLYDNTTPMDGWIGRVLIWDGGGISDADAGLVVSKLNSDFGI